MMTKEDALERLRLANSCPDVALTETIALIQLDAMREGMRRAASVAATRCFMSEEGHASSQAILTTAEQLTEKDLEV